MQMLLFYFLKSIYFSGYPLNVKDKTIELNKELVEVKRYDKTLHVEEIVPSVIEPSLGVGRIMYVVLEHSFRQRAEDEKRCVSHILTFKIKSKVNFAVPCVAAKRCFDQMFSTPDYPT